MLKTIRYSIKEIFNFNNKLKKTLWINFHKRKTNKIIKGQVKNVLKSKIIRSLNETKTLNKNWEIINLFQAIKPLEKKNMKSLNKTLNTNNVFKCTPIFFSLKKELIFFCFN